jgi:intracellular sulfur oxidation DsrE/DsrF family protein
LDRVVVVNNESFGGDDRDLGGKLMGIFLTKLRMTEKLPDAIVFFNSGVRLLTKDSAVRPSIEGLIEDGVDLLACGTCVKHYEMDEADVTGHVSNMQEIVGILLKANSVITM